jgi:hypothetical protein
LERANGILHETGDSGLVDPYELAAKTPFPYEDGELSKIYQSYPPEKRKKVNEDTNEQFRRVTGFTGKLDPSKSEHKEWIWKWFRIRDVVMQLKYGEKGTTSKAFKIEEQTFRIGPSDVRHDWENIARITTSVEFEVTSATIINTVLPYEAARNISREEALSEFGNKVKEAFSSPLIESFDLSQDLGPPHGYVSGHGYRLRFRHHAFMLSGATRASTDRFQPMLDLSKPSKVNFLWVLRPEADPFHFEEWEMSEKKGTIRVQMIVMPVS